MQRAPTEKQKALARLVKAGKPAGAAYLEAYGNNCSRKTADFAGHKILKQENVQAYMAELEADARKELNVTIESLASELEEARKLAMESGQPGNAVSAIMGKAKLYGLGETRIRHQLSMRPDEAQRIIETLLPKYQHLLPASLRVIENANDEDEAA